MYLKIGDVTYRKLNNIQFNPEADLFGESMPVGEFSMEVHTNDSISVGSWAELRDDLDNLWARYVVVYSERQSVGVRSIRAASVLYKFDGVKLGQMMILESENKIFGHLVYDVFRAVGLSWATSGTTHVMPDTLYAKTVYGYFPEQTARERLLWLCVAADAYARDFFSDKVYFLPYSPTDSDRRLWRTATGLDYPAESAYADRSRVYWKPSINYGDQVSSASVEFYSYSLSTSGISRMDEYVDILKPGIDPETADPSNPDNFDTYVRRKSTLKLANPDFPSALLQNDVEMTEVTCINGSNVNGIVNRLALHHFNRTEVSLDVIDNGEIVPGMMLTTFADEDKIVVGFVRSASFSFGLQAKASLTLVGCTVTDASIVTIRYMWGETMVLKETIVLPSGYPFERDALYFQVPYADGHIYVLRPGQEKVSGVATAGGVTIDVPMYVALEYLDGTLYTVSVDELTEDTTKLQGGSLVVYK